MAGPAEGDFEITQPKGVLLRRIFGMAWRYRWLLAAGMLVGMGVAALALLSPYFLGAGLTEGLRAVAGGRWTWQALKPLVGYVALFAGARLASDGLRYGRDMIMVHLRMRVLTDLRRRIYRKILRQSFSYFDRQDTGQLINRAIGDVNMLRTFFQLLLVRGAEVACFIVGAVVALVWLDAYVALVAVPFVPLYALAMVLFSRRVHPMFHAMRHELDRATQVLSENVQGQQVVRAFGRQDEEIARYERANRAVLDRWLRLVGNIAIFLPGVFIIGYAGLLAMLAMTAYRALAGAIGAGLIYTVYRWSEMLTNNMRVIGRMTAALEHSLVSGERIFEILDARPEVEPPARPRPMPDGGGRVVFEHVWFGYGDGEPVLSDIHLAVPAGANVALVGPTGSGKSTLTKLLPRFYDPQRGRILIDGRDIREVDLEALRAEIGFVFQDTFLFSASLAENIAFGVPEAERRAIEEAARRAQVEEFARAFDQGYETPVGDRGLSLSGGQRQRVAIARALLTDPRILILDDATASVDATTERAIQDGLREVMRNRTTFIIAHRVSTVKRADLVVVVDEGRIVQQGTHDDLLAQEGPYRDFVRMQWQLGLDEAEPTPPPERPERPS